MGVLGILKQCRRYISSFNDFYVTDLARAMEYMEQLTTC